MKKFILPLLVLMMAFLILPGSALAFGDETAELVSITPDATNINDLAGQDDDAPEGVSLDVFSGTIGQVYTAVYSVSEEPVMVVITGGTMEDWSYDSTAETITVSTEHTGYIEGSGDFTPYSPFGIAIVWAAETEEEDGPPTDMNGSWMATNLMNWNLIPPSDENGGTPYFGYQLSGTTGESGFFQMFMSDGTKDMLSEMADEELDWTDLAVYLDDDQASLSITETTGGALVDIQVTFSENTTKISSLASRTGGEEEQITKQVKVREQAARTFACKSYRKAKGDKFTCFGWIKNGKKNQKVSLWRKALGKKKWVKQDVSTLKNNNGYFKFRPAMKKKTASYKVYWPKKKKYTNVKKVRVTK